MNSAVLATALVLAGLPLAARADDAGARRVHTDHQCEVHTDWGVASAGRAFVFTREDGKPGEVGIGGGRLFIDGREQALGAADHARLSRLEGEMHALVPELRQVAVEAVDIAFTALAEVARGLASDPAAAVADLQAAQGKVRARMEARPLSALNGDAIEGVITPILGDFVPRIVGGAVTGALKAAFGGEQQANDYEKKIQRMEQALQSKVEARAKRLEPLADSMCRRLQAMDRIDDELEYRLPEGGRLELLRVGPRDKD